MTRLSLAMLTQACDLAMPLAMGMNIGLNVRRATDQVTASLDTEALDSALVVECDLTRVKIVRSSVAHMLWLGDLSVVVTTAEADAIEAFLHPAIDAEAT
jgi:hypothetical protein